MIIRFKKIIISIIRFTISLIIFFLVILTLKKIDWNIVIRFNYLPSFKGVIGGIIGYVNDKEFYFNIITSICRVYIGFGLAVILAIPLSILVILNNYVRNYIFPIFEIIRPIPNVAWVPLSIVLFKTINGSVLFITFVGAFFPVLINTIEGLDNINENYVKIALSFKVTKLTYIKDVMLPAALTNIYSGLLIGMSGAWLGVVVAEMISGQSGIGYLTWVNYTLVNMELVVVCMLTIGGLGAFSSWLIRTIFKKTYFKE